MNDLEFEKIINEISRTTGYSVEQIQFLLKFLKLEIIGGIKNSGKVRIKGIGIFRKKDGGIEYISENGEISYFSKDGEIQLLN